jgi:DUF4097 and DUF4098 domain-containing protein YvlB
MSNQESMFTNQEQQPYRPQPINTDPREQTSEQSQQEGYRGAYDGPEPQQWDAGKLRPQRMRRRGRGRGALLAIILLIALAVGGAIAYGAVAYSTAPATVTSRTFNVTNRPTLMMNVGSGNIRIHTGSGHDVIVKETQRSAGFMTSNGKVGYRQNADTITVQEEGNIGISLGFSSRDFDVTLPSASDLQLQTGSGSVDVTGINGQVSAETGSGSITANTLSGQQATLKTGSGSISANNISDQQNTLHTGSGSITVNGLSGQVTLDTGSGSTTVSQGALSGNSILKAGSGNITYNGSLDPKGKYRFETGSGDVDLTLPSSSAFNLDTHTGSGSVNNGFGSNQIGSDPRAFISISTGSGSIDINKG